MGLLSILLLVLFVITALMLIVIVMIQDEGGEGLGGIFGGGSSAQQVGNRSGNILTKTTSILGAVFLLSSFGLAWMGRTPDTGDVEAAARRLEEDGAVEWWRTDDAPQQDLELPELENGQLFDPGPRALPSESEE